MNKVFIKCKPGKHWREDIESVSIAVDQITSMSGLKTEDGRYLTEIYFPQGSYTVEGSVEEVMSLIKAEYIPRGFQAV